MLCTTKTFNKKKEEVLLVVTKDKYQLLAMEIVWLREEIVRTSDGFEDGNAKNESNDLEVDWS